MALKTSRKKQNVYCGSICITSVKSYHESSHPLELQEVLSFTKLTWQTLEPHWNILGVVAQLGVKCSLSETQLNTSMYSIKPLLGKKSSAGKPKSFFSKGERWGQTHLSEVIFLPPLRHKWILSHGATVDTFRHGGGQAITPTFGVVRGGCYSFNSVVWNLAGLGEQNIEW